VGAGVVSALRLVPVVRDEAVEFIGRVHRHHGRPVGYRFAVGVEQDGELRGVAVAGRPSSRVLDNGRTIEVTRLAVIEGTWNACSVLYGACWRAARALGYVSGVTYTQTEESGASLRASGWRLDAVLPARPGWDVPSRRRTGNGNDDVGRYRWWIGEPR
jgi:hypothetical protein